MCISQGSRVFNFTFLKKRREPLVRLAFKANCSVFTLSLSWKTLSCVHFGSDQKRKLLPTSLPVSLSQNHSITHGFSVRTWMSDNNIKQIVSVFVKVCLGGENHLFPLKTRFYRVLLYSDTDMR